MSCGGDKEREAGQENKTPVPVRYDEIEKASWLLGGWQGQTPEGIAGERWEKKNDSTYSGKGYFMVGKDTVSSETMSLEQNSDGVFYIPTVKEQNNGQPVTFKMTKSTETEMVFENPQHDFPQKITYTRFGADSVVAEISGMMEGKPNAMRFPMKRMN